MEIIFFDVYEVNEIFFDKYYVRTNINIKWISDIEYRFYMFYLMSSVSSINIIEINLD